MNKHMRRLDAVEPVILTTMPLDADLEALLRRLAHKTGIAPDELRQEAIRVAMATRGMTDDERLAHMAGDLGCSPAVLRAEMDALTP
ncbi:MAG TPA: hypothetical protein VGW38_29125 [Chloroflexota bacterium]|nr:hypothetical protein [Chloroflexota bacterium]